MKSKKLLSKFNLLLKPNYWFIKGKYSKLFDDYLIKVINSNEKFSIGKHYVKINDTVIRVSKKPIYIYPINFNTTIIRPSRITALSFINLIDTINEDTINHNMKDMDTNIINYFLKNFNL